MNPANPVKKLSQWTFTHQSAGGTPTTNLRTMAAKSECDNVGEHEKSNRIHGPALLVGECLPAKWYSVCHSIGANPIAARISFVSLSRS